MADQTQLHGAIGRPPKGKPMTTANAPAPETECVIVNGVVITRVVKPLPPV